MNHIRLFNESKEMDRENIRIQACIDFISDLFLEYGEKYNLKESNNRTIGTVMLLDEIKEELYKGAYSINFESSFYEGMGKYFKLIIYFSPKFKKELLLLENDLRLFSNRLRLCEFKMIDFYDYGDYRNRYEFHNYTVYTFKITPKPEISLKN